VFEVFSNELGNSKNAQELKKLFQDAYLKSTTLTEATRVLANTIFGENGLVIIDGDDKALKRLLVPFAKQDIFNHIPFKKVSETTSNLKKALILPNLCYIGGGGELAYWLELKSYFTKLKVTFPMLLLRNSALLITKKQAEKVEKLNLSLEDLFMEQTQLINKKIRQISNIDIDFSPQKQLLDEQFKQLYKTAQQTDASFLGAVKAQEAKQKKGLEKLEKRLLKAQKRKLKDQVVRLTTIQNELFPNCSLQERHLNFSESYLAQGDELLSILFDSLDPLRQDYLVLYY